MFPVSFSPEIYRVKNLDSILDKFYRKYAEFYEWENFEELFFQLVESPSSLKTK